MFGCAVERDKSVDDRHPMERTSGSQAIFLTTPAAKRMRHPVRGQPHTAPKVTLRLKTNPWRVVVPLSRFAGVKGKGRSAPRSGAYRKGAMLKIWRSAAGRSPVLSNAMLGSALGGLVMLPGRSGRWSE